MRGESEGMRREWWWGEGSAEGVKGSAEGVKGSVEEVKGVLKG